VDPLANYQSKRDFDETPEPAGTVTPADGPDTGLQGRPGPLRFVVQEHHATALHWDLRLERGGVLVSWALPKGVPPDPRVNHLAVHTEDHPMQYLAFHGEIPSGNYGAGIMTVWDTGTYEAEKWSDREAIVVFHGERVQGRYALFQTRGNQWMIHRMDPPADPDREVWPGWSSFPPAPLVPGSLPANLEEYGIELAWGGQRVLTYVSGGRVQLHPDGRFPEVRAMGGGLGVTEVVLDGSIIVLGADGRPSPSRLAERLAAPSDTAGRRLSQRYPAILMISDLLWLDGHRTVDLPYSERRHLLEALPLVGPASQVPPFYPGPDGPALLAAAGQQGLPGVVAKMFDGPYGAEAASIFIPALS
jgi:bifunctional non-homologous end joining protein LigD